MSNVKEISKKRKQLSLPVTRSLMGSFSRFSRGKNQYDLQPSVKKMKNSLPYEDSSIGYGLSSVSIRDLRLRRVFSPSSTDGVIPKCFNDTKNLGKSQIAGISLGGTREPFENGGFKKSDMSNEEFVLSTPPDAEVFGAAKEFSDQCLEKKQSEKGFHEQSDGMNYSMNSVLQPCSREKLFKTPGSFSYRRLLPFLMDIEKDHSGSQIMGHCQKSKKGFDDKHLLASNVPKTLLDKTTSCSLESHNTDSGKSLIAASVESFTSKDNESSSMPLVNGEIQKLELQPSCDDQNLSCSKNYLSSTIEDSHFNEKLVAPSNRTLTDNSEVAKTNVEYPCNARSHEVFDQTLSTVNDKCESCDYEVTESSKDDTKKSEIQGMPKATICDSSDGESIERVEELNGECMSMTPPDSDMFSKCEINDSRGNTVDNVSQGTGQVIQKSTNETFQRNNGQGHDNIPDSSPKNNTVPNPHLHMKLSKIPGSFNYRRLLPYLIDVTSHNKSTSSSNHKLKRSPPKQVVESPMFMDSELEPRPLVKPSALDTSQKLETRPKDVDESLALSSSSPRGGGAKFVAYQLPLETEDNCIKSTEKCANNERQIKADSFVEASIPSGVPSASLRKGILKRNPRGCRGVCACLNCSSFWLHAERSFEFSRNQMQDAEEVALDLMKELSYLRNMLEKCAFVAKDQTNICIDQVKEACKKASDAEELAKTRLSEMNYHLNIHCRIPCGPRPTVRFADHVKEHVFNPIEDSSNK